MDLRCGFHLSWPSGTRSSKRNGIAADHQRYLILGGRGFLLGDGSLNYGRENLEESYYNAHEDCVPAPMFSTSAILATTGIVAR